MDISIIVITYNHQKFIKRCLKSINDQIFSGSIEILIADDNSEDRTSHIIKNYIKDKKNLNSFLLINLKKLIYVEPKMDVIM